MKVKELGEKAGLKLRTGSFTSWKTVGETMGKVTDFILGGSKITADGDCSLEIKRHCSMEEKL